jgi:hypothetical protein
MSVALTGRGEIALRERCGMAEAETLQSLISRHPTAVVDWRECSYAHTAVVQVLLAARPKLLGPPTGPFLRSFVDRAVR